MSTGVGLALVLLLVARPAVAQTSDPPRPDVPVLAFEAALDAHDLTRASDLLSESALVVGTTTLSGKPEIQAWIQDQIDHGVIVEIGTLHVNGSRVTWTARISHSGVGHSGDWGMYGRGTWYVDEEAAVAGDKITVLGSHERGSDQPPLDTTEFVRASQVLAPTPVPPLVSEGGVLALLAVICLGLLTGLYWVPGIACARYTTSIHKGRLLRELSASPRFATRRSG